MKVIARTSLFFNGLVALVASPIVLRAIMNPTRWSFLWAIMAIAVVVRVSQIRVSVGGDFVRVSNFFKTVDIPVWEAEIELGEKEGGGPMSDLGGKLDEGGRLIYVRRSWHNNERVHVGAAPRYGAEAVRIHDDLVSEIRRARAA